MPKCLLGRELAMIDLSQYEDRYCTITLGQSMKIAWRRMKDVLFRPFTLVILIPFALLGLFARLAGGEKLTGIFGIQTIIMFVSRFFTSGDPAAILGIIAALVIGLFVWLYIEARLRLVYLDSIANGKIRFFKSWRELKATGRSLFHWEFAVACVAVAYLLGVYLMTGTYLTGWVSFGEPYYALAVLSSFGFLLLVDFVVIRLIMPLMFIKNINLTSALKLFLKLFRDNKSDILSFFFASLGINIPIVVFLFIARTVLLAVSYFVLSTFAFAAESYVSEYTSFFIFGPMLIGFSFRFIFGLFFQPIQIWYQAWALAFYGGFGDDFNTLLPKKHEDALAGGSAAPVSPESVLIQKEEP